MSSQIDQAILSKIQKLLALSKSTNPNEAAIAYAKAYQLLAKHQLSLADVEVSFTTETVPGFQGKRFITWKKDLVSFLAKLNNCYCFLSYGTGPNKETITQFKLAGHPTDIEVTNYLYQSISNQIEVMSALSIQDGLGNGKTFTNNFKHGALSVVFERLTEAKKCFRAEVNQTSAGQVALVKIDSRGKEAELWAYKIHNLQPVKQFNPMRNDDSGFELGQRAGSKINLNTGLPGTKPKLLT